MNTQLSNLLRNHPNQLTMSSVETVQLINAMRKQEGNPTELRHATFLEKVREVLSGAEQNFQSYYLGDNGKQCLCYNLPKRETILMVMSESYKVQAAIYDKLQELEQQNSFNIPTTFAGALALAAKMAEENEKLGVTVRGQTVTIYQQAEVIDHKRIVTDESEDYISVARVRSMNPNQRYSGALLGRISDKLNIPVIPQHAAKGQKSINTYHKSVWELAYPEASLFD